MPAPLVGAAVLAATRVLAAQVAKQTGKKLTQNQMKAIAIKVAARSERGNKVSKIEARRIAEKAAGPKARREGGNAALRATAPKPGVRITTKSGKYRGYGTLSKEKTTVTKPIKRETNKKGRARTIKNKPPMSKEQIERAQIEKNAAAKKARSIQSGAFKRPARPGGPKMSEEKRIKNRGLAVVSKGRSATKISGKEEPQGITVRGKLYRDANPGIPARGQSGQGTLEERISSGLERATYGRQGKSNYDAEAENLLNRSLRALGSPKAAAKETVRPGKPTKTTIALRTMGGTKAERTAKLKGTIRNQRKVLREREIKQAAEKSERTLDAVVNKMVKRGASKSEIERVIAAKRKADSIGARVSVPRPRRGK